MIEIEKNLNDLLEYLETKYPWVNFYIITPQWEKKYDWCMVAMTFNRRARSCLKKSIFPTKEYSIKTFEKTINIKMKTVEDFERVKTMVDELLTQTYKKWSNKILPRNNSWKSIVRPGQ